MDLKAFPLNQTEYSYNAQDVMKYYAGRNSGVFETGDNLKVSANGGLELRINTGMGWLSKDYVASVAFWNESVEYLMVEAGHDTYDRIDLVVVSWNFVQQEQNPKLIIRKGTPASSPVIPSLVNDSSTIEIALARINVKRGRIELSDTDIVDLRGNDTYCPLVYDEKTIREQFDTKASKEELDFERKRIDLISTLPEGSTTADAELINIRLGADGVTYDNAGNAVRTQISALDGKIATKSPMGHTHDDRYYTENEIDIKVDEINSNVNELKGDLINSGLSKDVDFSTATSGFVRENQLIASDEYYHSEPIELKIGQSILVNAKGYADSNGNSVVNIISKVVGDGYIGLVGSHASNTKHKYLYTATSDMNVVISYLKETGVEAKVCTEVDKIYGKLMNIIPQGKGVKSEGSLNDFNELGGYWITPKVSDLPFIPLDNSYLIVAELKSDFRIKYLFNGGMLWYCIWRVDENYQYTSWKRIEADLNTCSTPRGIKSSGSVNDYNLNGGYFLTSAVSDLPSGVSGSSYMNVTPLDSNDFVLKQIFNNGNLYYCVYRIGSKTFWTSWSKVNTDTSDLRSELYYEIENLERRVLKAEKGNDFAWKEFDKPYFVFIHDDTNSWLETYAQVFFDKNVPMGAATIPSALNDTHIATLHSIENAGGEVLGHYSGSVYETSSESEWLACTRDIKKSLEEKGFTVRGLIRAGSTTASSPKGERYCRKYFDYANDKMGISTQYDLNRNLMLNWNSLDAFKSRIQSDLTQNGIHGFGFHGGREDESWITAEALGEIIDLIQSNGGVITTYSYLFDTFGTTVLEKRLSALENA